MQIQQSLSRILINVGNYFLLIFDCFHIERQVLRQLGQLQKNLLDLNIEPSLANSACPIW
jgi:hypothetical protein